MKCPDCQSGQEADSNFCDQCGGFLSPAAVPEVEPSELAAKKPKFRLRSSTSRAFSKLIPEGSKRTEVTLGLVGLNVLIFVITVLGDRSHSLFRPPSSAIYWGANYAPLSFHAEPWRLLTCMFLHAGILHLAFNMYFLYDVGQWVESIYGSYLYLWIYLVSGLGSSIISAWWHPAVPGVGASGAIFGIIGALLGFTLLHHQESQSAILKKCLWSSLFISSYALRFRAGIDMAAHISGLLFGLLLGLFVTYDLELAKASRFAASKTATGSSI